jgi:hypothetical protein
VRTAPTKDDSFTFRPTFWVGAVLLLYAWSHELDRILNLYLLVVPLILLPTVIVAIGLLVSLIANAVVRRWRRCASVIAAPVIAGTVFGLAAHLGVNPDRVRLEFTRAHYMAQIAQMPREADEPRLALFDWGQTGGAAVINIFHTLVYDESDEIALPSAQRSAEWNRRVDNVAAGSTKSSILGIPSDNHSVEIKKLGRHFYLLTEYYP